MWFSWTSPCSRELHHSGIYTEYPCTDLQSIADVNRNQLVCECFYAKYACIGVTLGNFYHFLFKSFHFKISPLTSTFLLVLLCHYTIFLLSFPLLSSPLLNAKTDLRLLWW